MDCVFEIDKPSNPLDDSKESRWILRGLGVASDVGNIIAIKTHNIIIAENPGPTDPLFTEEITTDYYHSNHRENEALVELWEGYENNIPKWEQYLFVP